MPETHPGCVLQPLENGAQRPLFGQIVGDFLLEYKISNDGRVRGKAFNRSNTYNPIYANQAPYTQGAGISYQENFSSFSHLTCRIRSRFLRKSKQEKLDCDELERQRLLEKQRKLAVKKGVTLKPNAD